MSRSTDPVRQLVQDELARQSLAVEPPVSDGLVAYVALLARWSTRIRLTASAEPSVLVERHLADAVAAARLLGGAAAGRMIDAGSGGGLPAVPLALLLPAVELTLVEASQRKCAFLRTALHGLGLGARAEVCCGRLEQLTTLAGGFDLACSRATWAPGEWLCRGAALLTARGGRVLVFAAREERLPAPRAGGAVQRLDYQLGDGTPRVVAAYEIAGAGAGDGAVRCGPG